MINHVRTLLLNKLHNDDEAEAPWDRYMPEEFRPIELPGWLESIRHALVGSNAWFDMTYKAELILSVLSKPPYTFYHTWLDRRTTEPHTAVASSGFYNVVGHGQQDDEFSGLLSNDVTGDRPVKRVWRIQATGAEEVKVIDEVTEATYTKALVEGVIALDTDIAASFNVPVTNGNWWLVSSYTATPRALIIATDLKRYVRMEDMARLFRLLEPGDDQLTMYLDLVKTGNPEDVIAGYTLAYVFQASKLL